MGLLDRIRAWLGLDTLDEDREPNDTTDDAVDALADLRDGSREPGDSAGEGNDESGERSSD